MRALTHRNPFVATLLVAALAAVFAVLPGCGGAAGNAPDDQPGFEPVTCSSTPSPCA